MSSFFIVINKNHSSEKDRSHLFPEYSKDVNNNIEIYYKGNNETLLFSFSDEKKYIVSGLGITYSTQPKFLLKADWKKIFNSDTTQIELLNGHFAACLIEHNEVSCFNDKFGLREIYYYDNKEVICISTRMDLFKRLFNFSLSETYLAGQWLTTCSPFFKTPYNELKRLESGGSLFVSKEHKIKIVNSSLDLADGSTREIQEQLGKFTLINFPNKETSLGLSGGLDSRTLLAIMQNNNSGKFSTHTFGSENLSDVKIARQIVNNLQLEHKHYAATTISVDSVLNFIKTFIPFTGLTVPISDLIHIDYHRQIYESNFLIQDGGFGEIGRRQYLNRFLLKGEKIISQKDTSKFIDTFRITKSDILTKKFQAELNKKLVSEAEFVWDKMKDIPSKQAELWADLFMTRFKLPNGYSYGQHCLDQISTAYMPFAQPSLLKLLLPLNSSQKNNGKLYRSIIKSNEERLEQIDLVKDYVEYPYSFGTLLSYLVRKTKRKLCDVKTIDSIKYRLYDNLHEYIGDEIHSSEVQDNPYYDLSKIRYYFDEYYSGNKSVLPKLDWWLTFNEWFKIFHTR